MRRDPRLRCWGPRLFHGCLCALYLLVSACSPADRENQGAQPDAQTDLAAVPHDVQAVYEHYSEEIKYFPKHPATRRIFDEICAAYDEALGPGRHALDTILEDFGDSNLALYAAEEKLRELREESDEMAESFLESLRSSDSEVLQAFAFDMQLRGAMETSPEEFLSRCDAALEGPNSTTGAIALLRRANYHFGLRNPKRATLDYLQFCALEPVKARALAVHAQLVAALKSSGLILEAKTVKLDSPAIPAARYVLNDLRAHANRFEDATSTNATAVYIANAPHLDQIAPSLPNHADVDETLRIAVLQLWHGRLDEGMATLGELAQHDEYDSAATSADAKALTALFLLTATDTAVQSLDPNRMAGSRQQADFMLPRDARQTLVNLLGLAFHHAMNAADAGLAEDAGFVYAVVEKCATLAVDIGDLSIVRQISNDAVERFPQEDSAVPHLEAMAKLYENRVRDFAAATEVYDRIVNKYPHSDRAPIALASKSYLLFQNEDYENSYVAALEFLRLHPGHRLVPVAKFLEAVSEAELGDPDGASQKLLALVEDYQQSDVAPKALRWLGERALATLDYEAAELLFQRLVTFYPTSDEARLVDTYLQRLKEVPDLRNGSPQ